MRRHVNVSAYMHAHALCIHIHMTTLITSYPPFQTSLLFFLHFIFWHACIHTTNKHTQMYMQMHTYVYTYTHTYDHINHQLSHFPNTSSFCISFYACIQTNAHTYACQCIQACTHRHRHTHTHTHTHTRILVDKWMFPL